MTISVQYLKSQEGVESWVGELQALLTCLFWPPDHTDSLLVSCFCTFDVPRHVCLEIEPAGDGAAVAACCWLCSRLSACCGAVTKIGSPIAGCGPGSVCQVSSPWGHGGLYKGSEGARFSGAALARLSGQGQIRLGKPA